MPNLVNQETGRVEFFRTEEVPDALASGRYVPEDPQQEVSLVGPDGTQFTVPLSDAARFAGRVGEGGVQEEDPSEVIARVREQRLEEEFGDGVVNTTAAALEGVASGLTLGFGDPLIEAIDPDFEERRKRNPTAFAAGEIGSLFVPGVGILGAGAKSANLGARIASRTPLGLVTRAGDRVAAKVGVKGGRILGTAAAGATEGALFTGGHALSNMLFDDKPLTAEAVLADMGGGALFGGGIGAVGGAFASGISRIADRSRKADEVEKLQEFLAQTSASAKSQDDFARALSKPLEKADNARKVGLSTLRGVKDPEAAQALSASLGRFDEALAIARREGTRGSAETLSRATSELGDSIAAAKAFDPKTGLLRSGEEARNVQAQIDDAIQRINPSASPKLSPQFAEKLAENQGRVMRRLEDAASEAKLVANRGLEVSRVANRSDDAARFESALDDFAQAERGIRKIDLSPAGVAKMSGKDVSKNLEAVSRYDSAVRTLAEVSDPKLARRLANDLDSLRPSEIGGVNAGDILAGAEALGVIDVGSVPVVGGAAEALLLGWAVARVGGAGLKKGSGFIQKAAQRGSSSAAFQGGLEGARALGLGRGAAGFAGGAAAALGSSAARGASRVSEFAGRTFERIDRALNRISKKPVRTAATFSAIKVMQGLDVLGDGKDTKGKSAESLYKQKTEELARAMANQGAVRNRVRAALAELKEIDPLLAGEIEEAFMRKISFLSENMPRRLSSIPLFGKDKWRPSRHEIDRFARLVNAVEDPVGVLEGLSNGKLTLGAVEAIRSVYPSLYREMQVRLLSDEELIDDMPYRTRIKAAHFFDVPEIEPSTRLTQPTAERFLQLAEQGQGPQTGTTPPPPQRTRDRALTPAQRLQE